MRQSLKRKTRNTVYKQKLRDLIKQARLLASQGNQQEALKIIPALYKAADKAAKENVIKKGTADRIKARLMVMASKQKNPAVAK